MELFSEGCLIEGVELTEVFFQQVLLFKIVMEVAGLEEQKLLFIVIAVTVDTLETGNDKFEEVVELFGFKDLKDKLVTGMVFVETALHLRILAGFIFLHSALRLVISVLHFLTVSERLSLFWESLQSPFLYL